jgi:copper transport protein
MNPLSRLAAIEWPLVVCEELMLGTAAFVLAVVPRAQDIGGRALRAFRPLWFALAAGVLVATPLAMLAQVAQMAGVSLSQALGFVPEAVASTNAGFLWACRIAVAIVVGVVAIVRSPAARTASRLVVLLIALLGLQALSSHAVDYSYVSVALYLVHEAAAGLWFGGLAGLVMALNTEPDAPWLGAAARRVSAIAAWMVLALALSGVALAYQTLGVNLARLVDTPYGRTLLAKSALFAAVLALGGYNRYRFVPASEEPAVRKSLARTVAAECVLLVAALAAASILANTAPPH